MQKIMDIENEEDCTDTLEKAIDKRRNLWNDADGALMEEFYKNIMSTEGMIKSRRKIEAIINNAKCFLKVIEEFGSFDNYIWSFSDNHTMVYTKHQHGHGEVKNELSDRLSLDMKKKGFKYLGSITIFSHLQACGIINDHACNCFKYQKILKEGNIKYIYE